MARYVVQHDYRAFCDGAPVRWRRGEVIEVTVADVAHLVRDAPGLLQWDEPLTAEQAVSAMADHERHLAEQAAAEQRRQRAIGAHVKAWGGRWCPGDGRAHEVERLVAAADGDGWAVTCPQHAVTA